MKRTLKILGIAGLSLVGLAILASAALYLFVDLDSLVNREVARLQPEIEAKLGRRISLGAVRTRFFPTLGARIHEVEVAAEDEAAPPLLRIREAGFDLNLLRTLLSLGRRLEVGTVFVDGLELRIERDAQGRLSFQDILDRQRGPERAPRPLAPSPAPSPRRPRAKKPPAWLEALSIGEIRLRDGALDLVDHQTLGGAPAHSAVRKIGLRVRDVRLSDPIRVEAGAAIFAEEPNFSLQARLGPLPPDLDLERLVELRNLQLQIDRVALGPLAPYLGDAIPLRVEETVISASYDIPHLDADSPLDVQGFLDVRGLRFDGGETFDLRVDSRFKADPLTFSAQIDELGIRLAEMEVALTGSLFDLDSNPRFEGFSLKTSSLDPARLLALYPGLREALPPGSRLAGPLSVELTATGDHENQEVDGAIDLSGMEIFLPGRFSKPAATPLALRLDAQLAEGRIQVREAALRVDDLELALEGELDDFEAPVFDIRLQSNAFRFDRLVRLAPTIGEELLEAGASAQGEGQLRARLAGSVQRVDGELFLTLLGADLDVPQARIRGDVRLEASVKGNPKADLDLALLLDAGASEIRIEELMNKGPGTPLVIDLRASRSGTSFAFERFDVRLAELRMRASGAMVEGEDSRLAVELEPLDLEALARTFPLIPGDRVRGGRVEAAFSLAGDPSSLSTVSAEIERFSLQLAGSDLQATATIRNLDAPVVQATLRSRLLDVDALQGLRDAPADGGAEGRERADDPALKKITLKGDFEGDRVILTGRDLRGVRARVRLEDGRFVVEEGSFSLYRGTFRADGSEAEIWRGKMPFHLRFQGEGIDLESLVQAEMERRSPVAGRAQLTLDLSGVGIDRESLEERLSGAWNVSLPSARVSGLGISRAVLGSFSSLPGYAAQRLSHEETLRDLVAGFEIRDGKMELREPVLLELDGSPLRLEGAVGIFGELFLEGSYQVPASRIAQLTGGRCRPAADPRIPLRIGGKPLSPEVRPDASGVLVELTKACLGAQVERALDDALGAGTGAKVREAAQDLEQAATERVDEAKAAVKREADEAKAAAAAEAERLKAEAERKRKEAEEEAKRKARDAADKLRKRLPF